MVAATVPGVRCNSNSFCYSSGGTPARNWGAMDEIGRGEVLDEGQCEERSGMV
jgi:hypothetical protein